MAYKWLIVKKTKLTVAVHSNQKSVFSTLAKQKKLHTAFILIRCTKSTHKNCKPIRNALIKNFKNVLEAYTTSKNAEYCIAGKALVKSSEILKFEKDLEKLTTPAGKVGVSALNIGLSI